MLWTTFSHLPNAEQFVVQAGRLARTKLIVDIDPRRHDVGALTRLLRTQGFRRIRVRSVAIPLNRPVPALVLAAALRLSAFPGAWRLISLVRFNVVVVATR